MARKSKSSHFLIKRSLDDVLKSDGQLPPRPPVFTNRPQAVKIHSAGNVTHIRDNLVRIEQEADPLGFLIAVQRGDLIPVHTVDADGDLITTYQQAGLADRITTAKFLVNKLLPNLSVTKHLVDSPKEDDQNGPTIGRPGQPSFAALVSAAASRSYAEATPVVSEVIDGRQADSQANGQDDRDDGADPGVESLATEPG